MQDCLTINSISWRNFRSYGNNVTQLFFGKPGVTTITGRILDKTTHGNTNNGVGKSTIAEALVWTLYDKSISDVKVDELINNINQKNLETSVEFTKGGNEYVVSRFRKLGKSKSNGVKLLINGEDKTLDSVAHTNNLIAQIIGMPFDTFVLIVVITATKDSFLDRPMKSANGANQTDFFEWMFNLSLLTDKAEILKEQIKLTNEQLKDAKTKLLYQQQTMDRYQKSLDLAKKRVTDWDQTTKQNVIDYQQQLDQFKTIDAEQQQQLHVLKQTTKDKITNLSEQYNQLNREIQQATSQLSKDQREQQHLNEQKCPYCLQKYEANQSLIDQLNKRIIDNQSLIDQTTPVLKKTHGTLTKQRDKLQQIDQLIVVDSKQLSKLSENIAILENKIESSKTAINPMVDVYQELVDNPPDIEQIDIDVINQLDKTSKHQDFLLKLLTKKDSFIRKNLLAKAIPYLNTRLAHYLAKLDADYKVEFDLELNVKIAIFGRSLSYESLSNGQKAKINIIIPFAFRDVLQKMYGQVNICICDEVLDFGLDETSVLLAANMIRGIAKEQQLSVYVISHKAAGEGFFDNQIFIEMENRFSNIVNQ